LIVASHIYKDDAVSRPVTSESPFFRNLLVALVILGGFGLAAYAISAVVTVSKGKHHGD
jgi:hypothetical protein